MERVIGVVAAAWWIGAVATFLASICGALLQPRLQRGRATGREAPPVSLLLPVKSLNPGFARAQASVLTQEHRAIEIIVGAAEDTSAALCLMKELFAGSTIPTRFMRSTGVGAMSPKLDTLAAPLDAAHYDVVMVKDSNISLAPDTVQSMLRSLVEGVGLVCAVPVAVRAETIAGNVEAILINRDARLLLTASAAGRGFGVGKVMLFRRSDLAKAGGVAAISYTIAEDSAIAKGFADMNLRTVFADTTVDQEIGIRRFADVYARQARWAVIRRAEEPFSFPLEPLACPLPAAVAAAAAAPLIGAGPLQALTLTLLGWYATEVIVTAIKGWEIRPWTPPAFIGRDLVLLGAWIAAWTTRQVDWGGGRQNVHDVLRRPIRSRAPSR